MEKELLDLKEEEEDDGGAEPKKKGERKKRTLSKKQKKEDSDDDEEEEDDGKKPKRSKKQTKEGSGEQAHDDSSDSEDAEVPMSVSEAPVRRRGAFPQPDCVLAGHSRPPPPPPPLPEYKRGAFPAPPPPAASLCAFENHTSRRGRKMKSRHRRADAMHPKTSEVYIDAPHAVTQVCTISGTHKYVCAHKYSM